jgi:hypothetical protein
MGKFSGQAQLGALRTDDHALRASYTFSHPSPLYLEWTAGRVTLPDSSSNTTSVFSTGTFKGDHHGSINS